MFQSRRGCCGGPIFTGFWKSQLKDFDKHICLMLIAFWFSVWSLVCYLPCALRGQSDMPCLDLTFPYVTCLMFSIVKALASSAQCKRLRLRRVESACVPLSLELVSKDLGRGSTNIQKWFPTSDSTLLSLSLMHWIDEAKALTFQKGVAGIRMYYQYIVPMDRALHDTPACHSYNKTHDQEWSEDNVIHIC